MAEQQSEVDENLFLLEGLDPFYKHTLKIINHTSRHLAILSDDLDFSLYNNPDLKSAISRLARKDRNATIRILVKKTKPLVERNHLLLSIARKLPSKIRIRKLTLEPEDNDRSYLIGDRQLLLYKHDDKEYSGFANYRAGPEITNIIEDFNYLWQQHSVEDTELRVLSL